MGRLGVKQILRCFPSVVICITCFLMRFTLVIHRSKSSKGSKFMFQSSSSFLTRCNSLACIWVGNCTFDGRVDWLGRVKQSVSTASLLLCFFIIFPLVQGGRLETGGNVAWDF